MGRDKLALEYNGETLLHQAVRRFSPYFDRVFLSLADADKYPDLRAERVPDIYPGQGPMAGLHAGLARAEDAGVFLLAADLPLATPEAARRVIELAGDAVACAVRQENGKIEPLFGYYRKELLPELVRSLESGQRRMTDLLIRCGARLLPPEALGGAWSEGLLDNINRPEDYERLISRTSQKE
jgi:molybdopterin-guanine dinucleotide biosynthesis protein A